MENTQGATEVVGVVGLGLMGSSIAVALLAAGHPVAAVAPLPGEKEIAQLHIRKLTEHARAAGMLQGRPGSGEAVLRVSDDYSILSGCNVVLECVVENEEIKRKVYREIAAVVGADAIIASNTSAIPISELQEFVPHPERFMGIHWAEPAYMTRFLEVTCGAKTAVEKAEQAVAYGISWGKEPTLLKKDIRGFITNRLMYAVYREAFSLIEKGCTTMGDADKAFRYDAGAWITFMGIFRWLDFMGVENYLRILDGNFKVLSNREDVPREMKQVVVKKGRGVHNLEGLYAYTPADARRWQQLFAGFNEDIFQLASRYREAYIKFFNEEMI